MSLILEALRKSEAERRRGLPPDLRAELPPPPARRGRVGMVGAAAIAAVLVALAAWFALRAPAPPGVVEQPDARTTPSAPAPRRAQPALPARTPEDPAVARGPTSPLSSTEAPEGEPPSPPAATPAPAADTARISSAPVQGDAQPVPAAPPPPEATTAKPDAGTAGEGRVLSLAELDPGTRDALPPLKLTMHLWNPEPERRFVILDGQRLGEGDRIGEARIARIERDGVLLEWHGRGIHVPVR